MRELFNPFARERYRSYYHTTLAYRRERDRETLEHILYGYMYYPGHIKYVHLDYIYAILCAVG